MNSKIGTLIPHRPPMRLVDELVETDKLDGRVRATITPAHLFLREDGTVAPEAYCEMIAQCFAACEATRREQAGLSTDGGGYLVNIRDFTVFSHARAGDTLTISTRLRDDFMGTRIVDGVVLRGTEKLAVATVYIFMWEGKTPPVSL